MAAPLCEWRVKVLTSSTTAAHVPRGATARDVVAAAQCLPTIPALVANVDSDQVVVVVVGVVVVRGSPPGRQIRVLLADGAAAAAGGGGFHEVPPGAVVAEAVRGLPAGAGRSGGNWHASSRRHWIWPP
jgi:hypothetical protein